MESEKRKPVEVSALQAGWRADKALCAVVDGLNRRTAKGLFHARLVRLNGKMATGSERVAEGDRFEVPDSSVVEELAEKANAPKLTTPHGRHLIRLYEDEALLVIGKPAEIPVHHGQGGYLRRDTLEDVLERAYPPPAGEGEGKEQGYYFVHRLDMETSGCLVIAKSAQVRDALIKDFSQRRIHKEYLAIVVGALEWETLTVTRPITYVKAEDFPEGYWRERGKASMRGLKKGIALPEGSVEGKPCLTEFRVLSRFNGFALLHALPKTGRTHQIRVHLASTGHPLAYDPLYGRRNPIRFREFEPRTGETERGEQVVLNRHPLHAWKLGFTHPISGKPVNFEAPLPRDLKEFLRTLKKFRATARTRRDLEL